MSIRRRLLRSVRKRVGFLLLIATLYAAFVLIGGNYNIIVEKTESVVKIFYTSNDAMAARIRSKLPHPGALGSRLLLLTNNAPDVVDTLELSVPSSTRAQNIASKKSANVREKRPAKMPETDEEFLARMAEVQRKRHALIRDKCRDTYNITQQVDFKRDRDKILSWKKLYEHAYANDDYKFIICRVLKVGSFSWRKVMRSLYHKSSRAFRRKQKMGDFPMRDYDNETFLTELQTYTKILFVREPFARLLSAYRDKFVELRHFLYFKPIGSAIIKRFRKGATKQQIDSGRPTFVEFLQWLVKNPDDRGGDFHWRPLFDWYHPCEVHYDYIGKLETAAEDARYVFKMIGIDKRETYPSTETHHSFSSAKEILKEFYSKVPPGLLPKLIYRHREEFVLFNYTIPKTLKDIWER